MRFFTILAAFCGLAMVSGQGDDFRPTITDTSVFATPSTIPIPDPEANTATPSEFAPAATLSPSDAASANADSTSTPQANGVNTGKKSNVGAIAGGVVGGVFGLALIGALVFFLTRRKRKNTLTKANYHHEGVVVNKSRASSPISHTSPIYGGVGGAPAAPQRQLTDPEFANPPVAQQPIAPQQQQPVVAPVVPTQQAAYVGPPAELHSREVDEDGVSVSSFDMSRPAEESAIPRLPVYQPKGSGL